MTYLVTGAAGFIGYHVCTRLLARGDTVVGLDSINDYYDPRLKTDRLRELGVEASTLGLGDSTQSVLNGRFIFIRAKIEEREFLDSVFASHRFDCVLHLAAQAGVRHSIDNPHAYLDSNLRGFLNILESCRRVKIAHLVFASSSSVYGLNANRPYSVTDHTDHPVSLYAATKKANELMAHSYAHLYGMPTTGLRFFTVYGTWGRPDMAYFKFADAIMKDIPIEVYNGGDMYRDFTYIDDIVEGLIRVAACPPAPDSTWDGLVPNPSRSSAPYRIYNIGNNKPERLGSFIDILESSLGKKAQRINFPMQAGDVYATEADITELSDDFGWKPTTGIEDGLARFAEWYLEYKKNRGNR